MPAGAEAVIRAQGLQHGFTAQGRVIEILKNVSLAVHAGESLAIVGPSGCGKSTLLGLLAGLQQPNGGCIQLCGQDIAGMDEDARAAVRRRHCAVVFQSFQLLPELSALENVALPMELFNHDTPEAQARHWLQRVGLGHRLQHRPQQLSGGEQQRVALARAFALQPAVLFADEPTANLDADTARAVSDCLFNAQAHNGAGALLLVTHDERLWRRCDRVLTLHEGALHART